MKYHRPFISSKLNANIAIPGNIIDHKSHQISKRLEKRGEVFCSESKKIWKYLLGKLIKRTNTYLRLLTNVGQNDIRIQAY